MTSEKLPPREQLESLQTDLISLRKELKTLRTEMNVKIDAIGGFSIIGPVPTLLSPTAT